MSNLVCFVALTCLVFVCLLAFLRLVKFLGQLCVCLAFVFIPSCLA